MYIIPLIGVIGAIIGSILNATYFPRGGIIFNGTIGAIFGGGYGAFFGFVVFICLDFFKHWSLKKDGLTIHTIPLFCVIGAIIGSILAGTYITGHQFSASVWAIFGAIFGGGIGVFLAASAILLGYVKHKVTWFPSSSRSRLGATPTAPAAAKARRRRF
jgi:hypothetical protein